VVILTVFFLSFCLQTLTAQSAPDLIVTKRVSDAKVKVGEDVTFTIQVKHQKGLEDTIAENVVVTDTLPVGLKPYTDKWTVTPPVGDDGELKVLAVDLSSSCIVWQAL
jgi:uncharacterized repeat protein (TIGR01451 family)